MLSFDISVFFAGCRMEPRRSPRIQQLGVPKKIINENIDLVDSSDSVTIDETTEGKLLKI